MKCVILAAGKGKRMGDLSIATPKPMLVYKGKNLLEHKFDALPDEITDIVLVIGYLGDKIKGYFGNSWNGRNVHYIEQKEALGTAHSLLEAKQLLTEEFLVLMGDDIYSKEDLEKLVSEKDWAILVNKSEERRSGGKIIVDENNCLKEIVEDKENIIPSNLTYTGACVLCPEIFNYEMARLNGSNEFGLPQTFSKAVGDRPIKIHYSTFWKQITSPEDLE